MVGEVGSHRFGDKGAGFARGHRCTVGQAVTMAACAVTSRSNAEHKG